MTDFRNGFLSARSRAGDDPTNLIGGHYDLIVLVCSWDTRSVAITKATGVTAKKIVYLDFKDRDQQGLRDKHDPLILSFASQNGEEVEAVTGHSADVENMWPNILKILLALRNSLKRPISVLVDLSSCPRFYALAIAASSLGTGLASVVTVFYSEGLYEPSQKAHPERHEAFTTGKWSSIPIPGLVGRWEPGRPRFYLASVGFEGAKIFRSLSQADPDRVAILLPDPGVQPDYAQRTWEANRDLFEQFHVPDDAVVRAPAGDAIAAWKKLTEAGATVGTDEENIFYSCCGTKPHSLALALHSLCRRTQTVLYNLPDAHKVTAISPSGVYWSFQITDLSALPL